MRDTRLLSQRVRAGAAGGRLERPGRNTAQGEAGHSRENARASLQVQQLEVILKEHRFSAWWLAGGLPAILWRAESQVLR